jgi:monovalent cation/proton antiporter MnhG/PhaG subunit
MLRTVFPHPFLSLVLLAVWLGLVNTVTLGNVLLGAVLGIAIPMLTSAYWPDRPKLARPLKIIEYALVVLWDIVVANVQVALIIFFKPNRDIRSAWITVPARPDLARGDHRIRGHHHDDTGDRVGHALRRRAVDPRPCASRRRSRRRAGRHEGSLRTPTEGDFRMIEAALSFAIGCYAVALLLDLWRIARGPDAADRILALDTMVINVIALLVLYGIARGDRRVFRGGDARGDGWLRVDRRLLPASFCAATSSSEGGMDVVLEFLIAAFLVMSGVFGFVGSYGLIKLRDTMQRLHAPTKATTLGVGGVLIASILYFVLTEQRLSFHELLITLFLFLTAPRDRELHRQDLSRAERPGGEPARHGKRLRLGHLRRRARAPEVALGMPRRAAKRPASGLGPGHVRCVRQPPLSGCRSPSPSTSRSPASQPLPSGPMVRRPRPSGRAAPRRRGR